MIPARVVKEALEKGWSSDRRIMAYQQAYLAAAGFEPGKADGRFGPQTQQALEDWERAQQGLPSNTWRDAFQPPDDDSFEEMVAAYGQPGDWANIQQFKLPYSMYLAWEPETHVKTVSLHKLAGQDVIGVLEQTKEIYGTEGITLHGLNCFGGGFNVRKMRGGSGWSTHAWGIAVDIDPLRNQLRWDHTQAHLAQPDCEPFIQLWLDAGWTSLGHSLDYDWMHFQKAKP